MTTYALRARELPKLTSTAATAKMATAKIRQTNDDYGNHTMQPETSVFSQGAFTRSGETLTIDVDGYQAVMHREH